MKKAHTGVLVESLGELVQGWGNLQALKEDSLLALEADVLGPLDVAGQVTLGGEITTNAEVARALLEQRVGGAGLGGGLLLRAGGGRDLLAGSLLRCLLHME